MTIKVIKFFNSINQLKNFFNNNKILVVILQKLISKANNQINIVIKG